MKKEAVEEQKQICRARKGRYLEILLYAILGALIVLGGMIVFQPQLSRIPEELFWLAPIILAALFIQALLKRIGDSESLLGALRAITARILGHRYLLSYPPIWAAGLWGVVWFLGFTALYNRYQIPNSFFGEVGCPRFCGHSRNALQCVRSGHDTT